jgi:hypothetical protein
MATTATDAGPHPAFEICREWLAPAAADGTGTT